MSPRRAGFYTDFQDSGDEKATDVLNTGTEMCDGLLRARGTDGALQLLEVLHFALGGGGFALLAIEGGEPKMGLGGE